MTDTTLSERLRYMADDAENLGIADMTIDIALIREAAELARKVEEAPLLSVQDANRYFAALAGDAPTMFRVSAMDGQRVRLVREER